jgi:hypothetical protein
MKFAGIAENGGTEKLALKQLHSVPSCTSDAYLWIARPKSPVIRGFLEKIRSNFLAYTLAKRYRV